MSRFLIIDDDELFCQVLTRSLSKKGFETRYALDAAQALTLAKAFQPNHCLLDLKLGNETGLRLIEPLKHELPDAQIVVLTGYASIATAVDAIKLGAANYICKPAHTDAIIAAFRDSPAIEQPPASEALSVDRLEWEHIQRVLAEHHGNISAAARALGMHRRTLQRKLQKRPS
ncbi:MAG TPA: response regulator transcription factor [Pseudomonadales bacterium]|nr:response regulator transcription factor [Pseudomonadales bacterium]